MDQMSASPPNTTQQTPTASPEDHNQQNASSTARKRRRLPVSCFACRKRKMRCDRALPCDRCVKGGIGHQCTYAGEPGGSPASKSQKTSREVMARYTRTLALGSSEPGNDAGPRPAFPPPASQQLHPHEDPSSVRYLHDRIHSLESLVTELGRGKQRDGYSGWGQSTSVAMVAPAHSPAAVDGIRMSEVDREHRNHKHCLKVDAGGTAGMMRGKNDRTRHYGQSHCANVIRLFDDNMATFLREAKTINPDLYNMRHGFDRYKDKPERRDYVGRELADLLPPRAQADELVKKYIQVYESSYRILHTPTFLDQYRTFWERTQPQSQEFVALLLAVMATVVTMLETKDVPSFAGTSSPSRETAVLWVNAVQAWLGDPQRTTKYFLNLNVLRIHCLIIIAQRTNHIRVSSISTQVATAVRMAMAMGLHREPSNFKKIPPFQCELRRRLWATIMEFDVTAAITRGSTPTVNEDDYDCEPPSNLNDEDIREGIAEPRPAKPTDVFTESSFLVVLNQSLPLRLRVARLVNSVHANPTYEDVLQLDAELLQYVQDIPSMLRPQNNHSAGHDLSSLPKILLDVLLRRFLLALHVPFITLCAEDPRFNYSRQSCLRDASILLSYHPQSTSSGIDLAPFLYREELFMGAITLCLDLFTTASNTTGPQSPLQDVVSDTIMGLIKAAACSYDQKVTLVGKGLKEYCFLNILLAIVRCKVSPENKEQFIRQAADKVAARWKSLMTEDGGSGGLHTPATSSSAAEHSPKSYAPAPPPPTALPQPPGGIEHPTPGNAIDPMFEFDPTISGDFSGFATLWGGIDDEMWSFT